MSPLFISYCILGFLIILDIIGCGEFHVACLPLLFQGVGVTPLKYWKEGGWGRGGGFGCERQFWGSHTHTQTHTDTHRHTHTHTHWHALKHTHKAVKLWDWDGGWGRLGTLVAKRLPFLMRCPCISTPPPPLSLSLWLPPPPPPPLSRARSLPE